MTDGPAPEVVEATVWLEAARQGATVNGVPCRVGIELEARQFVLELPDGRQAKLKLTAAQELIVAGNSANGHGAVNPGQDTGGRG